MVKYKIVYTVSDNSRMISDLHTSIDSALHYVSKEDIIVFFTPPLNSIEIKRLKKKCTVIVKEKNYTKPFKMHPSNSDDIELPRHFGDKLLLCTVDSENILFLDCDTYIYNDPSVLFKGDFDFGGVAIDYPEKDNTPWQMIKNMLEITKNVYNIKEECHLWNGGHLIFKNYTHHKIKDEWMKYFNRKSNMRRICSIKNTDDQLSLTPALASYPELRIKCFDENLIFKTGWFKNKWDNGKYNKTVCIFHGDRLKENINV